MLKPADIWLLDYDDAIISIMDKYLQGSTQIQPHKPRDQSVILRQPLVSTINVCHLISRLIVGDWQLFSGIAALVAYQIATWQLLMVSIKDADRSANTRLKHFAFKIKVVPYYINVFQNAKHLFWRQISSICSLHCTFTTTWQLFADKLASSIQIMLQSQGFRCRTI